MFFFKPTTARIPCLFTLVLALFSSHLQGQQSWGKTYLCETLPLLNASGFPVLDAYGDLLPMLPENYRPSVRSFSDTLNVLTLEASQTSDPPELDSNGFPIFGEYFQFGVATESGTSWAQSVGISELLDGMDSPHFADRLDEVLSLAYWNGNYLMIDTIEDPANSRLTLSIPKQFGQAAIDENGGVHVAVINDQYELWHYYYDQNALQSSRLSAGPVAGVSIAAGRGNKAHIAYTTFSEDLNDNGVLDEGEDINGNGVLDQTARKLLYQRMDGGTDDLSEEVIADTLIRLNHLDLYNATTDGLRLAFADPVQNSVRFASKADSDASSWLFQTVSSAAHSYGSVALAENRQSGTSAVDYAISYTTENGGRLYVSELSVGAWTESLVAESQTGAFFRSADVGFDGNGETVVVASEKDPVLFLVAYSRSGLTNLLVEDVVDPLEIRSAFVLEWAQPGEGVISQKLQSTTDLSDPGSWQDVSTSQARRDDEAGTYYMFVEPEGPSTFYRVLNLSE